MPNGYLLVADLHCHRWSQFATVNSDGVNSRLRIILDELERAAEFAWNEGVRTIVIAGDLMHVRGSIDPEVFNPVHSCIKKLTERGFQFYGLPGNHDLAGKDTTELGNAFQSLHSMEGFTVVSEPAFVNHIAFIPWCATLAELRAAVKELTYDPVKVSKRDLIIHAGIDGVLPHMPDHGLSAEEVASWGFRRVFAGHYHAFKAFCDYKVVSIGPLTHHTFSEAGHRAGFILVREDGSFKQFASHAPSFVSITGETPIDDYHEIVDGNYVRVRDFRLKDDEVKALRAELGVLGAKGVSIEVARETVSARSTSGPVAVVSLAASVGSYVDGLAVKDTEMPAEAVKAACADIMSKVLAGTEESA